MTAIITNGGNGATGNSTLTGASRVVVTGNFGVNAHVNFEITVDSLTIGQIYVVTGREPPQNRCFTVNAANNDILTATVFNGDTNTSIDVSMTAL